MSTVASNVNPFESETKERHRNREKTPMVNESLKALLTKEMFTEVEETFEMCCEDSGSFPVSKLPTVLKALGMSMHDVEPALLQNIQSIDFERFIEVITSCLKQPNWAAQEMTEGFALFDRESAGNITPGDLRVVFARLGENLLEKELEDQIREFDIDGDLQMAVAEYYKMVASTRGTDFEFEDSV